jgi:hypothetical protein
MPLAHHPEPDEVDCLLRNCELRNEIEPYLDESIWEIDFRSLPTPVENRFLESMLDKWCQSTSKSVLTTSLRETSPTKFE